MSKYYVNNNAQNSGDHEVHVEGCSFLEMAKNTTFLGNFPSCKGAVAEAKKTYSTSDGCAYCCKECHKR